VRVDAREIVGGYVTDQDVGHAVMISVDIWRWRRLSDGMGEKYGVREPQLALPAPVRIVRVAVSLLVGKDVALDKLGARGLSAGAVQRLLRNDHVVVGSPRGGGEPDTARRLLGVAR
jgi:hypothetical protein